jgi:hypothetical protein
LRGTSCTSPFILAVAFILSKLIKHLLNPQTIGNLYLRRFFEILKLPLVSPLLPVYAGELFLKPFVFVSLPLRVVFDESEIQTLRA